MSRVSRPACAGKDRSFGIITLKRKGIFDGQA
jgi:hypothetical protein